MYKDLLTHTPLLALPILAMFAFLTVFLLVVVTALMRRRGAYDAVAQLPCEDEHG